MKQISVTDRNFHTTLLIAAIAFMGSCKKDSLDQPSPVDKFKTLRVKTITGVAGTATEGYANQLTYDASGRIVKEQETGIVTDYSYAAGKVIKKIIQDTQVDSHEYELNADGYVRTFKIAGSSNLYTYEYSAGGMPVRSYDNQTPQYETRYYYSATFPELLDSTRVTHGGVWNSTATFVYALEHINTLRNQNLGQGYFGNLHPRPILKHTYTYMDGLTVKTQVTNFTYTYDKEGRISSKSFVNDGSNLVYTYTYY